MIATSLPPGLPELLPLVVEIVFKVTVVLGATWGAAHLLRRSSAAVRHLVWTAGLAAALALPLVAGSSPWRWELVELPAPAVLWTEEGAANAARDPLEGAAVDPGAAGALEGPSEDPEAAASETSTDVSFVLLVVWGAGTAATIVGFLRGLLALRRIRRRATAASAAPLARRVERLAREVGLAGTPRVLVSDAVDAPLAAGVLEPAIVLPPEAERWSRDRLDPILIHELAHVQRRDLLTRLLARLCCALYWFHPLAWVGARRLGAESERACDDRVLEAGTRPSRYAAHLLEIAGAGSARRTPGLAASMARRSEFEGRLLSILDPETRRDRGGLRHVAFAVAAALLLSGALAVADAKVSDGDDDAGAEDVERTARPAPGPEADVGTRLVALLSDPDPDVRAAAADALGDRVEADATPHLIRALDDPSKRVRKRAAVALGRLESPASVPGLAEAALDDRSRSVRKVAIWALGETESGGAVRTLVRIVREAESRKVRRDAIRALGETRHPAALEPLGELVRSGKDAERRKALKALAELGLPEADAALVKAMESDDPHLRSMAARALAER